MTELTKHTMAVDLETALRGVPGVTTIFRVGGVISGMIDVGAHLIGAQQNGGPLIRWEHDATDGSRAEAAIGVHTDAGAVETSRRAHAAITKLCADRGFVPVEIRLTVVHIDDGPPSRT